MDMANKNLFKSLVGKLLPGTDAVNEAGGIAYKLSPKATLAQYAATGCLNATFRRPSNRTNFENRQRNRVLDFLTPSY
jgi:hypothetical protein